MVQGVVCRASARAPAKVVRSAVSYPPWRASAAQTGLARARRACSVAWCVVDDVGETVQPWGAQQASETMVGQVAGGGGDQDQPGGRHGLVGPRKVGQGAHAAHGVPGEGYWASDGEVGEHVGEVAGELFDRVGAQGRGGGAAVAAVVVGDDAHARLAVESADLVVP